MRFLDVTTSRARTTISLFFLIMLVGVFSYRSLPVEQAPEIAIPVVIITIPHEGISPEDSERLLARPVEAELKGLKGLKSYRSFANEGLARVIAEFDISVPPSQAMLDAREAVDRAKAKFPDATEEPNLLEASEGSQRIVQITISGTGVDERTMLQIVQDMQREIEMINGVLSADLVGEREELLEIEINPAQLETYGITNAQMLQSVSNNNRLIPAGALDTGHGSFPIKLPGLIETQEDLFDLPLQANDNHVVTLSDVATIRKTFKDATRFSFINAEPSISINVEKRAGASTLEVMDQIDAIVAQVRKVIPQSVKITYVNNQVPRVNDLTRGLEGNMATAMLLVLIVVIATVGVRSGILVALSVPFSFFFAFIMLAQMGFTYNFMVIFGLLLGLGMLIDGAIVMVEFADREMVSGLSSTDAYSKALKRMLWPIMASTATTLAAFLPIMFWPDIVGEFMRYLPITVFLVLVGALLYALVFGPTLGALFAKTSNQDQSYLTKLDESKLDNLPGITGHYARILEYCIQRPGRVSVTSLLALVVIVISYFSFGRGVEFFVSPEPMFSRIEVYAKGNYSPTEIKTIVSDVERRVMGVGYYENVVTQSGAGRSTGGGRAAGPDLIGTIFIEFVHRDERDVTGHQIQKRYREVISDIPGARAEVAVIDQGPPVGKEIQLELTGEDMPDLVAEAKRIRRYFENNIDGLIDIDDTGPVPGIEWEVSIDRARAAMLGASVTEVGSAIQLLTNGVLVGKYRPDGSEDEVDIRVRYPREFRGLEQIDAIKINTLEGLVPVSSFIQRTAKPEVSSIQRVDGKRVIYVRANPAEGVVASKKLVEIEQWLQVNPPVDGVNYRFRGANEEQTNSFAFLLRAFALALALMAVLLVTQFNSFYQAFLILSSVLLSTAGVLLGLLITGQTFSVIMSGVGIVALAGIIVNNNIVLVDTYNHLRKVHQDWSITNVIVHTGVQRLRPVFLTTFTTGFGLLPLALGISIDLVGANVEVGGPVATQWAKLASAIVFGLTFATVLTLLVTPAMLMLPVMLKEKFRSAKKIVFKQPSMS